MGLLFRPQPAIVAITDNERAFFVELGGRIQQLRKDQGITQVQLAEQLGVSQQTVTAYENGSRRVPISHLPRLAQLLGVSIEDLLGERKANKRGPASKLQQLMARIAQLPRARQQFVIQVIESVLAQRP
jgi:transcriptional regulator with XRE-family HTH domain